MRKQLTRKQVEDYKTQQAAYDKALEEYNAKRQPTMLK